MQKKQNKTGYTHYVIVICGIVILFYMFAKIKIQILIFKLIDGIIAASMIHNTGYVILFSTMLVLTLFILYSIPKWMIFEVIFPEITIVDEKGNKMHFKRALWPIRRNGETIGWYIKFRLYPLLEFDKFILDKAQFERKIRSIYVYANNWYWDEKENVFKTSDEFIPAHFEDIRVYRFLIDELNTMIGRDVGKAVAGDPWIRKEKFEEGLPNPKRDEIWKKEEV